MPKSLDNTDRSLFFCDFSIKHVEAAVTFFQRGFKGTVETPCPQIVRPALLLLFPVWISALFEGRYTITE